MAQLWDREVDVLVVGSGAGGLMAALVAAHGGAQVLVVEKDREWGGTSATSGGGIWIVGSDQARAAGFDDDPGQAFAYVRGLSAANVPDDTIRAYIDHSAPMLRWLTAHTQLRYIAQPYPDYHAENPGGSPRGYRTHLPDEFDGRSLGGISAASACPRPPPASSAISTGPSPRPMSCSIAPRAGSCIWHGTWRNTGSTGPSASLRARTGG